MVVLARFKKYASDRYVGNFQYGAVYYSGTAHVALNFKTKVRHLGAAHFKN